MEQKKTLVVVVHFPDTHPSLRLETIETAEEFADFAKYWLIDNEDIAKSWTEFSSGDADALQGLLRDRSEGFYEDEHGGTIDDARILWELYRDCEFLVRLL